MAAFDGLQKMTVSAIQTVFGDLLSWTPSGGGAAKTSLVLFNKPESKGPQLGDVDKSVYNPYNFWFDYYQDQLEGLKQAVDAGEVEIVTVNGLQLYVREVVLKFDGKTCIAFCDEYVPYRPLPIEEA